ncbi:MAG: phosphoribosyltransferase [Anaerolineae bacterium]
MQSYDYAHRQGVEEISWAAFGELAAVLAERLAAAGIDTVVGIARAGLFPATAVACMLQCELYPVRITRRVNDQVTFQHPIWKVDVTPEVAGRKVAVVDEISDSGETLRLVAERVQERGAARVVTACLISHSWAAPAPAVTARITDALVVFPWDKRVYREGQWRIHPELEAALRLQSEWRE